MEAYNGGEPFHLYLKKYFARSKKHGSSDRKKIGGLCYNYFRLGHGVISPISFNDKLLLAEFLTSTTTEFFDEDHIEYLQRAGLSLTDKLDFVKSIFDINQLFAFSKYLSPEIDASSFFHSFLKQPQLFIRARPGKDLLVQKKLKDSNIPFIQNQHSFELSPATKLDELFKTDRDVVVQDFNSQQIAEMFSLIPQKNSLNVWDCCAASGGKSILAKDHWGNIELTVSDSRKSILKNLESRFSKAGIRDYRMECIDLSKALFSEKIKKHFDLSFDLIIADVPCSGSGTWSRTPEQLQFFKEEKIEEYQHLQQQIIKNALPALKKNGLLLYITCSVFKKENEENVNFLRETYGLKLISQKYFKGYEMRADTLFAAVLRQKEKLPDQ